jgi:TolB protein
MHFTALYTMDANGRGLRRLTPVDEVAEGPKWSRDGKRIIYTYRPDDQRPRQIIAMTLQTGAKEVLAENLPGGPSISAQYIGEREVAYTTAGALRYTSGRQGSKSIRATHPNWSPGASQVVYERTTAQPSETTPVVAAYSISPRFELFRTGSFATFSSDGRRFLISGNLPYGNRTISIMDANGANIRTIFNDDKLGIGGTSWSSDGSLIAFGLGGFFERPVTPARLATIRPDGSDFRVLIQGDGSSGMPSFAPDGGRLVFRALGKDDQGLRVLSLADMKLSVLTTAWDNFPSWSPCGDRITFTRQVDGDFEIFSIKADGTELRQLTHDHGNNAHSTWSPDGQWIMFASSRMGRKDDDPFGQQPDGELFAVRADGTELQQLTDNRWEDATGSWLNSNGLPRDESGCKHAHSTSR